MTWPRLFDSTYGAKAMESRSHNDFFRLIEGQNVPAPTLHSKISLTTVRASIAAVVPSFFQGAWQLGATSHGNTKSFPSFWTGLRDTLDTTMASNSPDGLKPAFSRQAAKKIAAKKMYTASGESIRSLDAYMQAGGQAYNSAGRVIHNPRAYQNAIEASVRQNTTDPKYLYHYTTAGAAESIDSSGCVQASISGLAGAGVYCTAKPPRSSTENLLSNNYASATVRDGSYVSNYVRLDSDGLAASYVGQGRNVWKVDRNVHLDEHGGYVAQRSGDSAFNHADDSQYFEDGEYHQDYTDDYDGDDY